MVMFSHIPRVCKNHARSGRAGGSADTARPRRGEDSVLPRHALARPLRTRPGNHKSEARVVS